MAIFRNVTETIIEWNEKGWTDIANRIAKFRELSGIENYVFDDAEFYTSAGPYLELLNDIAVLLKDNLKITDLSLSEEDSSWKFEFKINGVSEVIILEIEDPEWFEEGFIKKINKILKRHGSNIFGRFVFPTGKDREDQCFQLCFITDETHSLLKKSKPKFA